MPQKKPHTIPPLPVPHRKQTERSDCLAACVSMVLMYLGPEVAYSQLLDLLDITPIGAPRRNITRLSRLGVSVVYQEATLPMVTEYLSRKLPVITFVDTSELSYWTTITNHAVVIVGLDSDSVYILDPAFDEGPIRVEIDEFLLAWLNCDYACAIVATEEL